MLTKNFKNMMAMVLPSVSGGPGLLPVKDITGNVRYFGTIQDTSSFPYTRTNSYTATATAAGWTFGSGTTPATDDDYALESPITSGLSCSSASALRKLDANGYPYVTWAMTVTNTSNAPITISEIGYKQNMYCTTALEGTSYGRYVFLIDRTVLTTPITIPAGQYAVVEYTLKTILPSGE